MLSLALFQGRSYVLLPLFLEDHGMQIFKIDIIILLELLFDVGFKVVLCKVTEGPGVRCEYLYLGFDLAD